MRDEFLAAAGVRWLERVRRRRRREQLNKRLLKNIREHKCHRWLGALSSATYRIRVHEVTDTDRDCRTGPARDDSGM